MKRIILLALLFFLAGCGEDRAFMTPSENVVVIDVNSREYFINGKKVGDSFKDFLQNGDWRVQPILDFFNQFKQDKSRPLDEKEVHVHVTGNCTFNAFGKVLTTLNFEPLVGKVLYVIDKDFASPIPAINPAMDSEVQTCRNASKDNIIKVSHMVIGEKGLTDDEILAKRLREKKLEAECAEDFMMISVTVNLYDKMSPFVVNLNELGFLGGKRMYNIASEEEFWQFIDEIRSRESLQNKKDRDQILFVVNREAPVASMSHILRKLNDYGYEITFGYTTLQQYFP
jgi:hypothetical protein